MRKPRKDTLRAHARQAFIWRRLIEKGMITRKEIAIKFNMTPESASGDIRRFLRENPGVLEYRSSPVGYYLTEEWQDAA